MLDAARIARWALAGVGDAALGEWTDRGTAFHIKRRLTPQEQQLVGEPRDIRGTNEEEQRMAVLIAAIDPRVADALRSIHR